MICWKPNAIWHIFQIDFEVFVFKRPLYWQFNEWLITTVSINRGWFCIRKNASEFYLFISYRGSIRIEATNVRETVLLMMNKNKNRYKKRILRVFFISMGHDLYANETRHLVSFDIPFALTMHGQIIAVSIKISSCCHQILLWLHVVSQTCNKLRAFCFYLVKMLLSNAIVDILMSVIFEYDVTILKEPLSQWSSEKKQNWQKLLNWIYVPTIYLAD